MTDTVNTEFAIALLDSLNLDWDINCDIQRHHISNEVVCREYWCWIWKDIGLKTYMGNGETACKAILDSLNEFLANPPDSFTDAQRIQLEAALHP